MGAIRPNRSRELSIQAKLIASFLALPLAVAVVGAFGLHVTGSLTGTVTMLSGARLPAVEGLARARTAITGVRLSTIQAIDDLKDGRDGTYADHFRAKESARANAQQGMARFGELAMTPEEEALWQKVEPAFNAFIVANRDVWVAIRGKETQEAARLEAGLSATVEKELGAPMAQLVDLQSKIGDRITIAADESAIRIRRTLWMVMGGTLAAAALLATLLTRSIVRPLRNLAAQANALRDAVAAGRLEVRGDPSQVGREFRPIIAGMNDTMDAYARPIAVTAATVTAIAHGDAPPPITDDYQGDFDHIKTSLNQLVEVTARRNRDLDALMAAAVEGRLDYRADPSGYQGGNARVIQGMNGMLDALVAPLQAAATTVGRIARGDIPTPLTDPWQGDFGVLRDNLNTCIEALGGVLRDMGQMTTAQAGGDVEAFIDAGRFQGAYQRLAEGVNAGVRLHVEVLHKVLEILRAYAEGDFQPELERLPGKLAIANERTTLLRDNLRGVAEQIRRVAGDAVEGRLAARADASPFKGDWAALIGQLNDTLDALAAPVDEATRVLERLAERDLRARASGRYRGDHARIKDALNTTAQALHQALTQVSEAVEQVSSAAAQIASSSQAVATGASQQAASLQETTSSVVSVAELAHQATQGTRQATTLSEAARSAARDGSTAVDQLLGTMARIQRAAEGTSQIIRDVSDIAFQTNLLALNAAVEAARAGDAGRGFAVVAEEVRSLALRAKEAAKRTEDLIRESVKQAAEGEAAAGQAARQLSDIVQGVTSVTGVVGEIAGTAQAQYARIEQVNRAIAEMDRVTQQNAASAEQSSSTASELSGQAADLAALVASFQLEDGPGLVGPGVRPGEPIEPALLPGEARSPGSPRAEA